MANVLSIVRPTVVHRGEVDAVFTYAAMADDANFIRRLRYDDIPESEETVCSYCGSLSVERVIELLKTPNVHYSGSDWKYGWPHKFYIDIPNPVPDREIRIGGSYSSGITSTVPGAEEYEPGKWYIPRYGTRSLLNHKFYSKHLIEATPEQLDEYNTLSEKVFGVTWSNTDKGLGWRAIPNTQRFGTINADGEPVYGLR